eukprot:CAMPEP_0194298978 /NCGR_PEP_ID=MMETSP0169-20130528/60469_1 /TAXON_ID=218684 /ORGANISM="Corethron pennatum, Strain L29A3" /LENGTH=95 /DNA_ID=CAMNT_0039049033 /DNA_START=509 /DNA_END=796 /DNA_ORIENTATION=+
MEQDAAHHQAEETDALLSAAPCQPPEDARDDHPCHRQDAEGGIVPRPVILSLLAVVRGLVDPRGPSTYSVGEPQKVAHLRQRRVEVKGAGVGEAG